MSRTLKDLQKESMRKELDKEYSNAEVESIELMKKKRKAYLLNKAIAKLLSKFIEYDKGLSYRLTQYLEINHSKARFYLVVLDNDCWVDYDEIDFKLAAQLIKWKESD